MRNQDVAASDLYNVISYGQNTTESLRIWVRVGSQEPGVDFLGYYASSFE